MNKGATAMKLNLKHQGFLIAWIIGFSAFGQKNTNIYPDSFYSILDQARNNIFQNSELAEKQLNTLLTYQNYLPDTSCAKLLNVYGIFHAVGGREDSALHYFLRASNLFPKLSRLRAGSLTNSAIILKQRKQFSEAESLFKESEMICRSIGDTTCLATALGEMGSNFSQQGRFEEAVKLLLQSTELWRAINKRPQLAVDQQKLANTYMQAQNYEFALKLFNELLEYFAETNQPYYEGLSRISHSETLKRLGHFEPALKSASRGIELILPFKNYDLLSMLHIRAAEALAALKKNKLARFEFEKALEMAGNGSGQYYFNTLNAFLSFLLESGETENIKTLISQKEIDAFPKEVNPNELLIFYRNLSELHYLSHDYPKAYKFLKMSYSLADSMFQAEKKSSINELHKKYQTDILNAEKELEATKNELLTNELKNSKITSTLLTLALFILIAFSIAGVRAFRLKRKLFTLEQEKRIRENEVLIREKQLASQNLKLHKQLLAEKDEHLRMLALQIAELAGNLGQLKHQEKLNYTETKSNFLFDAYLDRLIQKFNNQHPAFISQLESRFPQLTKREKETCALLLIGCKSDEITGIMRLSLVQVQTTLYKICKKLMLKSIDEIPQFLTNLSKALYSEL
jgi:tetratricopeptide (TPR) repeat protein